MNKKEYQNKENNNMNPKDNQDSFKEPRCNFCGQTESKVGPLMPAPIYGTLICENCLEELEFVCDLEDGELLLNSRREGYVEFVEELFEDETEEEEHELDFDFWEEIAKSEAIGYQAECIVRERLRKVGKTQKPQDIKAFVDQYVIGQEEAKKALIATVYNHYQRLKSNEENKNMDIQKSNVLLLGPSGCGKTYLVQTIAKSMGVPFATSDATSLTEVGCMGDGVENVWVRLLNAAGHSVELAEQGIVYIDGIDKIAKKDHGVSVSKDVSGESVQQALLKMLEGKVVEVQDYYGRELHNENCVKLDTSNILFILGGSFEGLEEFRNKVRYGLIPEFIGRIPIITEVHALDKENLKEILTKPKNAIIKQFKALLDMGNIELIFEDDAIDAIADKAIQRGAGAGSLRGILEELLQDVMYTTPSDKNISKVIITKEYVLGEGEIKYFY